MNKTKTFLQTGEIGECYFSDSPYTEAKDRKKRIKECKYYKPNKEESK